MGNTKKPGPRSIYVIRSDAGPLKVGTAANARNRRNLLQTSSPFKLFLEYEGESEASAINRLEKIIHRALKKYHKLGEWFDITVSEAIVEIQRCAKEENVDLQIPLRIKEPKGCHGDGSGNPIRCMRIPKELWAQLDERAEFTGKSRSEVMRLLLNWSLENIDGPIP